MRIILSAVITTTMTASAAYAYDNSDDSYVRTNPEIESSAGQRQASVSYAKYPFLNLKANHIALNGHSWEALSHKFDRSGHDGTVNVVHIGDSHIQAEGSTSVIRHELQSMYGDAGRGLIIPFRLAGTNQPFDYRITSSTAMNSAKLLKTPWSTRMGFTGISLAAPTQRFTLSVSGDNRFDAFKIHGHGTINIVDISGSDNRPIGFSIDKTGSAPVFVHLDKSINDMTMTLSAPGANIYGIELIKDNHGVRYSAIGNNGATFSSYCDIPDMATGVAQLKPDLIILSLGTNEAFGKMSDETFYSHIGHMISDLRKTCPHAEILLVTPSECQRSVYTTVASGSKRKRRRRRIRNYAVNNNVERMARTIRRYGNDNHIPVYDFYEIAGGKGASEHWLKHRLLSNDRIHRTWAGYTLEGQLTASALIDVLTSPGKRLEMHSDNGAERQVIDTISRSVQTPAPDTQHNDIKIKDNKLNNRAVSAKSKKNKSYSKTGKKSKYSKTVKKKRSKKSARKRRSSNRRR